jgi:hypothetical protein
MNIYCAFSGRSKALSCYAMQMPNEHDPLQDVIWVRKWTRQTLVPILRFLD